jgi:hypothetical protein
MFGRLVRVPDDAVVMAVPTCSSSCCREARRSSSASFPRRSDSIVATACSSCSGHVLPAARFLPERFKLDAILLVPRISA